MVDTAVLTMVRDIVAILGVVGGFTYYVMTVRASQRTQQLTLKAQELTQKTQEQALETRQAQLFMQLFSQWNRKDFLEGYLIIMEAEFTNVEEFEKIFDTPIKQAQIGHVYFMLEGVGSLLHKEMIDPILVSDMFWSISIRYWEKMKPIIISQRKNTGNPRLGEYVEYLASEMEKLGEQIRPEIS